MSARGLYHTVEAIRAKYGLSESEMWIDVSRDCVCVGAKALMYMMGPPPEKLPGEPLLIEQDDTKKLAVDINK